MDYELIIRPEAKADLLDAFHWYQAQRTGLGLDFKLCVDEVVSKLLKRPTIYKKVHKHIRRALIRKFPFGIFYIIEENSIIVIAVIHARRNPTEWKRRI